MSKWWLVGMLVIGLMLIGGTAFAFDYTQGEGGYEVSVWKWELTDSTWDWTKIVDVYDGVGIPSDASARCFVTGGAEGNCNKEEWSIDVSNHASVAQWIDFEITGTNWKWYVRKPGTYAANCIEANLSSNSDVFINYDGFEDLHYVDQGQGVDETIKTYYAIADEPPPSGDSAWVRAIDLNNDDDTLVDSLPLHNGITWKLFNMITVTPCNSACEYHDEATITLVLQTIKPWIDEATGNFRSYD